MLIINAIQWNIEYLPTGLKITKLVIKINQITWIKIDNLFYYFAQMFHGQVNGQVICFLTRSFDLAWPGVAPPLIPHHGAPLSRGIGVLYILIARSGR